MHNRKYEHLAQKSKSSGFYVLEFRDTAIHGIEDGRGERGQPNYSTILAAPFSCKVRTLPPMADSFSMSRSAPVSRLST